MNGKTNNVIGKVGAMKPFTYKEVYLNKVEKVSAGVYNFKTYLDGEVIIKKDNLKKPNMYKVRNYIGEEIDVYEVENGIAPEPEAELEAEEEADLLLDNEEYELYDKVEIELKELEKAEEEADLLLNDDDEPEINDEEQARAH